MIGNYYTYGAPMWWNEDGQNHSYTLYWEHGKEKVDKVFRQRFSAEKEMNQIIGRYHLNIMKVYDDKHYKTYILSDDSKMHINRF